MSVASRWLIAQKVSNRVTPEVLKTLYSSMAPRIQAMVNISSGPTNYKKNFKIILNVFYQQIAKMSKCRFKYCQDSTSPILTHISELVPASKKFLLGYKYPFSTRSPLYPPCHPRTLTSCLNLWLSPRCLATQISDSTSASWNRTTASESEGKFSTTNLAPQHHASPPYTLPPFRKKKERKKKICVRSEL